jgi:predicted ATPase
LCLALGKVVTLMRGYAAAEVGSIYARAQVQQVGEPARRFPSLFGLWQFHTLRREFHTADTLARQLYHLAQHQDDALLLLQAHRALAFTALCRGDAVRARRHAEQGVALYDPQQHCQQAFLDGQDPGTTCLAYAAQALWTLGYPTQALHRSTAALAGAQTLQHPYSLTLALAWSAWLHQHRRAWPIVQERAAAVVEIASEHGFTLWVAQGTIMRGWALVMGGQGAEGITLHTSGPGHPGKHRHGPHAAIFSGSPGRGIRHRGADRSRPHHTRCSASAGPTAGGRFWRGGIASAGRGVLADARRQKAKGKG